MGIMNIFRTKFGKKIKIDEQLVADNFCVFIRLKKKRVKINSVIDIPEGVTVVGCYRGKPCDILPSGEITLNAGSLPFVFKKSNYEGNIKKTGKISNYFEAELYALSTYIHRLEFDVGRFVIKDSCYGKQKVNITIECDVKLMDVMKFFKVLIHEHPNLKKKNVKNVVCNWISYDTINVLKKQKYNIDEYMLYTSNINAKVGEEIVKRFSAVGIEIKNFNIKDIILPDDVVRDIEIDRSTSLEIHSKISDFEAVMKEDGVISHVDFVRSNDQLSDSVFENNYHVPTPENKFEEGMVYNRQSYFKSGGVTSGGKICEECGREVPSEANFCPYCATKIKSDINLCEKCGANNILDADFCYNCGSKLN